MVRKEICRLVLQNGKEIVIERMLEKVTFDFADNIIIVEYIYGINGNWWLPAIEEFIENEYNVRAKYLLSKYYTEHREYILYEIEIPVDEIDKIVEKLKESDEKVISATKEVFNTLLKVKKKVIEQF